MNRHSLLVISALALASCQSRPTFTQPRLIGEDAFPVTFHGRLSTAPKPLLPDSPKSQEVADADSECRDGALRINVQAVSVPRDWVKWALAWRAERRPSKRGGPTARAHNAQVLTPEAQPEPGKKASQAALMMTPPVISFFFDKSITSFPVQWWGPRGMTVSAADARPLFDELRAKLSRPKPGPMAHPFAYESSFTCVPGAEASVAVVDHRAFVESFAFEDDRNSLAWEPMISTAEMGFALQIQPLVDADGLLLDFRLQLRDVVGMPLANSRITGAYAHGTDTRSRAVTLQAPLFSDHVFEGKRRCQDGDAFVLFATNTVAEDEVLLALFEVQTVKDQLSLR